ncbi:MAG: metallophosphoesterase [Lachnospiraceae bacterium]|nr:metallophosphoesterase [Lachnospiraceae bacterium]
MKILVISDEESKYYWDYFSKDKFEGIDLIISCGDLAPQYLQFLVTMTNLPVLYVHGNHDSCYDKTPPDGCICIDDNIYVHKGIRIMGLGGSMEYSKGNYQFTEEKMRRRYNKLFFKLLKHKGIDILVTHSPSFEINDGTDLPHKGFAVFKDIMDKYKPKYHIHGHVHKAYGRDFKRVDQYKDTIIINACERYIFDYPD